MSETAKKLLVMELNYGGIAEEIYHFLPENEKKCLEERKGRFFLRDEERKKVKVVLTGGVYDILHIGHLFTLNEVKGRWAFGLVMARLFTLRSRQWRD